MYGLETSDILVYMQDADGEPVQRRFYRGEHTEKALKAHLERCRTNGYAWVRAEYYDEATRAMRDCKTNTKIVTIYPDLDGEELYCD